MVARLRDAVEDAGQSQVWVKPPAEGRFPPPSAHTPLEALVVAASYPRVLAALERQSAKDNLEIKLQETRGPEGERRADLRLARGGERVCRWRLREVRQLRRAAIVIDDLGADLEAARTLLALPYPLTCSVLPHLRSSRETAQEAHRAGREVMLHLPMEPERGASISPGPGEIATGMDAAAVDRVVEQDLAAVPYVAGVNNHMGSRATADAALMAEVMRSLAGHRLYFVDSRTTGATVALDAARRQGLPAFYRSVFLDDTETVPYTLGQLREFLRVVQEQGAALAIGHPHPTTLAALTQFLPELEKNDIQLVPPSELVRLPEVARLSPPRAR